MDFSHCSPLLNHPWLLYQEKHTFFPLKILSAFRKLFGLIVKTEVVNPICLLDNLFQHQFFLKIFILICFFSFLLGVCFPTRLNNHVELPFSCSILDFKMRSHNHVIILNEAYSSSPLRLLIQSLNTFYFNIFFLIVCKSTIGEKSWKACRDFYKHESSFHSMVESTISCVLAPYSALSFHTLAVFTNRNAEVKK